MTSEEILVDLHLLSFLIGLGAGALLMVLVGLLLFSGKLKTFSISKDGFKIESATEDRATVDENEQEIDIKVSGRWLTALDQPGVKWGDRSNGVSTPRKVKVKPGEVYRFSADFGITDKDARDVSALGDCVRFRSLTLFRCRSVSKAGLCQLKSLRHLWHLDLAETNTDDDVLDSLHALTSLKTLDISRCGVSREAVSRLRLALPNCRITTSA